MRSGSRSGSGSAMDLPVPAKLYLDDPYLREFDAQVLESAGGWCLLSRSAFYPGGGGQPCDRGSLEVRGEILPVAAAREDDGGRVWHQLGRALEPGEPVRGAVDWPYRYALMRHHGLMHVVNAVARERYGGAITGVQIGPERSRIDFKLSGFSRERLQDFEDRVNQAIDRGFTVRSTVIDEGEFRGRPELVRTLDVLPPVAGGQVRVVEMEGFDAQACGGTHVHSTREIGRARIEKFDNKGKDNKRFYWALAP
jgi:misacylated tRNA(Ala) deacylase